VQLVAASKADRFGCPAIDLPIQLIAATRRAWQVAGYR